jgi:hypothetical protein
MKSWSCERGTPVGILRRILGVAILLIITTGPVLTVEVFAYTRDMFEPVVGGGSLLAPIIVLRDMMARPDSWHRRTIQSYEPCPCECEGCELSLHPFNI